jgi:hypothetical protein
MKARDGWSIHDLVVDTKNCVSRRVDTDANICRAGGPLPNEADCPHQEVSYFRYRSLMGMLR